MKLSDLMPNISELIPYEYDKIQNKIYDDIIQSFLQKATPNKKPKFIQIGGIPGAGKSTFCQNKNWDSELFISFDAIMERIPQYQQDTYKLGRIRSFNKWEIPARVIGYEILRQAISNKADVFLEHSGVNVPHIQLMTNIKKYGYDTEMYFILCDVETGYQRAIAREKLTNRHTPREIIEQRASLVQKFLPHYIKITDNLYIYDTSHNRYLLMNNFQKGVQVK